MDSTGQGMKRMRSIFRACNYLKKDNLLESSVFMYWRLTVHILKQVNQKNEQVEISESIISFTLIPNPKRGSRPVLAQNLGLRLIVQVLTSTAVTRK